MVGGLNCPPPPGETAATRPLGTLLLHTRQEGGWAGPQRPGHLDDGGKPCITNCALQPTDLGWMKPRSPGHSLLRKATPSALRSDIPAKAL